MTRVRLRLVISGLLIVIAASGQELPIEGLAETGEEEAVGGAQAGETFIGANTAYEEGDYVRAIELFSHLRDDGFDSGHLHYNLGNAYLRHGELGRAIASYRRATRRLPRDEDVRANLEFARHSTKDALAPPEPSPVLSALAFWHYGLSPTELEIIVLVLNLLFWTVWAFRLFHPDSEVLRWVFMLLLVLLVLTGASLVIHSVFPGSVAVIIPQEIEAHTGPDAEAVVRFRLHAGTEVQIRDRRPGWLRISLPDGQQGWIDESWAEVVDG